MKIPPEHIKIEALNSEKRGGQQVGLGDPGVRVTHLPTGNVALCRSERSQLRNRELALEMIEWAVVNPHRR